MAKQQISSQVVLDIKDKGVKDSFTYISKEVKKLTKELKNLPVGTEEFNNKAKELAEAREQFNRVKTEIDKVNGKLKESEGFWGRLQSKISGFGLTFSDIAAGLVGIKVGQTAQDLLKISDAMADVQKTTGLALNEVKNLWDAFDEMDTRTSKIDRLKIAEVGGRLGVPKEELESFVKEVDKAYVALGDSFEGGLENVVDSLGKIKGLFNDTKGKDYATAINEVGSALNELAAAGTASEGNISDFALRVGALPDSVKPSASAVLGLGAAFEESGIDSQVAASGFSNFIKVAGENIESFAKSMQISVEEAKKLYNEKPEEFFLRFAKGMKGVEGTQAIKIFDSLKINSLEVQKAVGAAANRTEAFSEALKRSKNAMEDANSLNKEFAVKNNNSAAIVEKLKNAFDDLFTKSNILNFFDGLIGAIGWITGASASASDGVNELKNRMKLAWDILKVITVAILGYNASLIIARVSEEGLTKAKWLSVVADKANLAYLFLKRTATMLYQVTLGLLTFNLERVTEATKAFNVATKANPLGIIITLAVTAYTAYKTLASETKILTDNTKEFNEALKAENQAIGKEISNLKILYNTATDTNKSYNERLDAVHKLQENYPSYFGNIKAEIIMNGKAQSSYETLTASIRASARARAAQAILEKREAERISQEEDLAKRIKAKNEEIKDVKKKKGNQIIDDTFATRGRDEYGVLQAVPVDKGTKLNHLNDELLEIYKEQENLKKKWDEQDKELYDIINENKKNAKQYEDDKNKTTGGTNVVVPDTKKSKTKTKTNNEKDHSLENSENERKKSLEDLSKYDKLRLDLERKYQDEKAIIVAESQKKEEDDEKTRHDREVENIQLENNEKLRDIKKINEDIAKLEKEKSKTKNPKAKKNYSEAIDNKKKEIAIINELIAKNNNIKEQMEQTHQFRLKKIDEKYSMQEIEQKLEKNRRDTDEKIMKREEEIQQITTMEEAKIALSKLSYLKLTDQELKGIKTLEDAKKALREDANREALAMQLKMLEEEQALLNEQLKDSTGEAAEKLKANLSEIKGKILQVKGALQNGEENDQKKVQDEKDTAKGKVDLLGFSAKEWEDTFKNLDTTAEKINAVSVAVKAMSNAFSQYAEYQKSLNERDLRNFTRYQERKKKALVKQLNEGYINQEQYAKSLEELERERLNKESEMQYKEAKMQKVIRIADAISATALGVANSLKVGGPVGIVLASLVGALGAVQVGIISSQPLPEKQSYATGGYTGNGYGQPDASGYRPAGIVHEGEYVTPKWMLQNPVVADTISWMESIRTGRAKEPSYSSNGYSEGGLVNYTNSASANMGVSGGNQAETNQQMEPLLQDLRSLISDLKREGVSAYMVADAENGKQIRQAIKSFEKIQDRNSRKNK